MANHEIIFTLIGAGVFPVRGMLITAAVADETAESNTMYFILFYFLTKSSKERERKEGGERKGNIKVIK
jgi:hypothetical protein